VAAPASLRQIINHAASGDSESVTRILSTGSAVHPPIKTKINVVPVLAHKTARKVNGGWPWSLSRSLTQAAGRRGPVENRSGHGWTVTVLGGRYQV
jgi:hypothetical protein